MFMPDFCVAILRASVTDGSEKRGRRCTPTSADSSAQGVIQRPPPNRGKGPPTGFPEWAMGGREGKNTPGRFRAANKKDGAELVSPPQGRPERRRGLRDLPRGYGEEDTLARFVPVNQEYSVGSTGILCSHAPGRTPRVARVCVGCAGGARKGQGKVPKVWWHRS
jgi:hypothetical protein